MLLDSFLEGFHALYERLINLSLTNLTFRTTMESNKQTYAEFLNESEVFADWLKQIPFNFDLCGLKVNKDNSVTMVFKNSLDTDRFKPMKQN